MCSDFSLNSSVVPKFDVGKERRTLIASWGYVAAPDAQATSMTTGPVAADCRW